MAPPSDLQMGGPAPDVLVEAHLTQAWLGVTDDPERGDPRLLLLSEAERRDPAAQACRTVY
jgi:hypothetical protein